MRRHKSLRLPNPVPPENLIEPFFWSVFAIAITLQLSHNDGVAHPRREMLQLYPIQMIQPTVFLANLYAATSEFCKYDSNGGIREGLYASAAHSKQLHDPGSLGGWNR